MKQSTQHLLNRILEPVTSCLNREASRRLVGLRADPKVQARVSELATKCNEGELTREERAEYETYVLLGEMVAFIQAKARLLLKKQSAR